MTEINTLLLLIFLEALLVCGVVLLALIVLSVIKKRRDRAAARDLVSRVNGDEARRRTETRNILSKHFHVPEENLDGITDETLREERRFYQTLIHMYLKRDEGKVRNLITAVEALTVPYRSIQVALTEPPGQEDVILDSSAEELDQLQQENERLKTELGVTMETMGRMLNEYAAMYGGGAGESLDKGRILASLQGEGSPQNEAIDAAEDTEQARSEAATTQQTPEVVPPTDDVQSVPSDMDEAWAGELGSEVADIPASAVQNELTDEDAGSQPLEDMKIEPQPDAGNSQASESELVEPAMAEDDLVALDDDLDIMFEAPAPADSETPEPDKTQRIAGGS